MTATAKYPDMVYEVCSFHFEDGKDKFYVEGESTYPAFAHLHQHQQPAACYITISSYLIFGFSLQDEAAIVPTIRNSYFPVV